MSDNYVFRLTPDQAADLLRLSATIRETCADYGVAQPSRRLSRFRDKALLSMADVRRPSRETLEHMAAELQLPAKVVAGWVETCPAAVSGEEP